MNAPRSSRSFGAATPATFWQPRRYNQHLEITATARGGQPPVSAFAGALRGADIETKIDALVASVTHSFVTHGPEAGMCEARRYGIEDGARLYCEVRGESIGELCGRLKRFRALLEARPHDKSLQACRAFLELRILRRRGLKPTPHAPVGPHAHPRRARMGFSGASFGGASLGAKDDYGSYREYDTGDGYVYRQYQDGAIQIMRSPKGRPGTFLRGTPEDPNYARWQAITAQIRQLKAGRTQTTAAMAIQTGLSVLDTFLQNRKSAGASAAAPPPEVYDLPVQQAAPAFPAPLLWAGGALAVLVAGVVAIRAGRG